MAAPRLAISRAVPNARSRAEPHAPRRWRAAITSVAESAMLASVRRASPTSHASPRVRVGMRRSSRSASRVPRVLMRFRRADKCARSRSRVGCMPAANHATLGHVCRATMRSRSRVGAAASPSACRAVPYMPRPLRNRCRSRRPRAVAASRSSRLSCCATKSARSSVRAAAIVATSSAVRSRTSSRNLAFQAKTAICLRHALLPRKRVPLLHRSTLAH